MMQSRFIRILILTAAAVGPLGLLAACSGSTAGSPTSAPSTSTSDISTGVPAGTTTPAASAGESLATDGPCSLITVDEIFAATGLKPDDASEIRGGCRWENDNTPVVDLEVEKPYGDPVPGFANEKTLYADPAAGAPGVGQDSFYSNTDQGKVYWLQSGIVYDVWIQDSTHESTERADALTMAKAVSGRL